MRDALTVQGNVIIDVLDTDGRLLQRQVRHNRFLATGRTWLGQRAVGSSTATLTTFGVGVGTTAVQDADTVLEQQLLRQVASSVTVAAGVVTVQHYIPSGNTETLNAQLSEAGLFVTDSTSTVLVARLVYSAIEKTSNNALLFTWTVTLASV